VTTQTAGAGPRRSGAGRGGLAELARAAAAPVACAMVLTGLLAAWVGTGGAGTLTRVQIRITLAAVPMRGFTLHADEAAGAAHAYLSIHNLSSTPDELIAVRSPVAYRIVLTRRSGLAGPATVVSGLPIPGNGTLTLSPLGDDVVLEDPTPYESSPAVALTLVFRHAGQVTIDAPVTAPGTP
jgi:copper(I)-binding protein